jgi:hypothetical protein
MQAHTGDEVCSETIVIRSNSEWKRVVQTLRYDGERYQTTDLTRSITRLGVLEQDAGLFALRGASS